MAELTLTYAGTEVSDEKDAVTAFLTDQTGDIYSHRFNFKAWDDNEKQFVADPEKEAQSKAKLKELTDKGWAIGDDVTDQVFVGGENWFNLVEWGEIRTFKSYDKPEAPVKNFVNVVAKLVKDDDGLLFEFEKGGKTYKAQTTDEKTSMRTTIVNRKIEDGKEVYESVVQLSRIQKLNKFLAKYPAIKLYDQDGNVLNHYTPTAQTHDDLYNVEVRTEAHNFNGSKGYHFVFDPATVKPYVQSEVAQQVSEQVSNDDPFASSPANDDVDDLNDFLNSL